MPDNLVRIASMTTDPTERIDRRAIAEADRTRDAALARDADARRQLGVAESALRRATEAADAAAAEGFNLQAERAVSEAEMTLKAVSRVAARAAAAAAEAPVCIARQSGLRTRPRPVRPSAKRCWPTGLPPRPKPGSPPPSAASKSCKP